MPPFRRCKCNVVFIVLLIKAINIAALLGPSKVRVRRELCLLVSTKSNGGVWVNESPTTVTPINGDNNGDAVTEGTTNGETNAKEAGSSYRAVSSSIQDDETANIFSLIAELAAICLYQSDIRRDAIGAAAGKQASSATNWIHDPSAFALQKALDQVILRERFESATERDTVLQWLRWLQSMPCPTIVDLTTEFHQSMEGLLLVKKPSVHSSYDATTTSALLDVARTDQSCDEFLARLACRLVLLPSGMPLDSPLMEPPASIVYGKLLYGGVTRCRLLGNHKTTPVSGTEPSRRRAAVRTEVQPTTAQPIPAWMMYGGPDRLYEAVDMGPVAILEVVLLPRKTLQNCFGPSHKATRSNMKVTGVTCHPYTLFDVVSRRHHVALSSETELSRLPATAARLSGRERNNAMISDFSTSVGGLQPQIDAIVRRVLDGRVIRPADAGDETDDAPPPFAARGAESQTAWEAKELQLLGLTPVRGLLLYGPPGCGKTALAREISRALRARAPKIVSAPELLDRWVGGSEKLVRLLFAEAEAELAACNGDATKSALHVVVIDEIDAVFRKRSSGEDSGEATRSSVVNQILSKLDGINSIPNLLMIGMTNRKELLDDALLRPGRLEVHIEIPLPNTDGRREILNIHFDALRRKGRLSKPLCCAIDETPVSSVRSEVNGEAASTWRRLILFRRRRRFFDLASETSGFSGADIAGLVRCAGSLALERTRKNGNGIDSLLITLEDVMNALVEVRR